VDSSIRQWAVFYVSSSLMVLAIVTLKVEELAECGPNCYNGRWKRYPALGVGATLAGRMRGFVHTAWLYIEDCSAAWVGEEEKDVTRRGSFASALSA